MEAVKVTKTQLALIEKIQGIATETKSNTVALKAKLQTVEAVEKKGVLTYIGTDDSGAHEVTLLGDWAIDFVEPVKVTAEMKKQAHGLMDFYKTLTRSDINDEELSDFAHLHNGTIDRPEYWECVERLEAVRARVEKSRKAEKKAGKAEKKAGKPAKKSTKKAEAEKSAKTDPKDAKKGRKVKPLEITAEQKAIFDEHIEAFVTGNKYAKMGVYYSYAGPAMLDLRQLFLFYITGEKMQKNRCGIHTIEAELEKRCEA